VSTYSDLGNSCRNIKQYLANRGIKKKKKSKSLNTGKEFVTILQGTAQQATRTAIPWEAAWVLVRVSLTPPNLS